MKWIGQHIWDFVSRFRNDVYLETLTENFDEFTVVIGNDNKLYKSTTPSEKSKIQVRNDEGSTIPAGAPLYSKGEIGGSDRIKVGICVSSNPAKMPCIGIAEFEMNTTDTKDSFAITQGVYNTNIHGFTGLAEGDILYVNGGVAPHLTQTKPTNGDLIQNVGIVLKTNGTICQGLLVAAIGRTNDVPWPLYVDHTTQRVGIGTSSPESILHVNTGAGTANANTVLIDRAGSSDYSGVSFATAGTVDWSIGQNSAGNLEVFEDGLDLKTRMTIETGGNVGIGTTSPAQKLHVDGNIRVGDNADTIYSNRLFALGNADFTITSYNGYDLLLNPSAGDNVGIGTTSPTSKLHVIGDARIQGNLTVNGTYTQIDTDVNTTEQWLVTNDGTGPAAVINQLGSQDIFDVQDDGTSVFYIEDGGQIGIGTTSPTARLHIESADDVVVRLKSTDNKAYIALSDNDTDGYISSENSRLSLGANPYADANNLNIDLSNNNIGIGTTSPDSKLHVYGTSNPIFKVEDDGGAWGFMQAAGSDQVYVGSGPSANLNIYAGLSSAMTILASNRNVGIGTSSPSQKLDVNGNMIANAYYVANTSNYIDIATGLRLRSNSDGIRFMPNGTDTVKFLANGNVGVGTTSPGELFEVYKNGGDVAIKVHEDAGTHEAKIHLRRGGSDWELINNNDLAIESEGTELFRIKTSGNVGIGTASPTVKLDVSGGAKASGTIAAFGNDTSGFSGHGMELRVINGVGSLLSYNRSTSTRMPAEIGGSYVMFDVGGAEKMRVDTSGNVGIGTNSPSEKLHVVGNIRIDSSNSNGQNLQFRNNGIANAIFSNTYNLAGGSTSKTDFNAYVYGDNPFSIWTNNNNRLTVLGGGNVGIGTTSPSEKLEVNGNVQASSYKISGVTVLSGSANVSLGSSGATGTISLNTHTSTALYVAGDDNVGIGTTSPSDVLHIAGGNNFNGLTIEGTSPGIYLKDTQVTPAFHVANNGGSLYFLKDTDGDGAYNTILGYWHSSNNFIFNVGNVGIGTTSPSEKLEVNGNIKIGDSNEARFGAGNDLRIYHNGTNSNIENFTGTLQIVQTVDDGNITFRSDDGSGGTTEYFRLDGALGYTRFWKHARLEDNVELRVGTGNDLKIYHDGSNNYIQGVNGDLYIQNGADDKDIIFKSDDGSGGVTDYIRIDGGDESIKFYKDISNQANANLVMGGGQIKFSDAGRFYAGDSNDLQIYHDGSNSYIVDAGTGDLLNYFSNEWKVIKYGSSETCIEATSDGSVDLYYDNSKKLETTSTGVEVTGNINVSGSVQRQISTTHHTFTTVNGGSAAQDYWVPFIGTNELAAPNVTHRTVAPYGGILKKAIVHSTAAFGTSAQVRFHRIDNGTASVFTNDNSTDDVTTNVTRSLATAYTSTEFIFTTGNTFSAGDQIGVSFVRNNTAQGDVAMTLVWEYELF